jgi:hypothetical protein
MVSRDAQRWAFDNYLHANTLKYISNVGGQIVEVLEQSGIIQPSPGARGLRLFYGSAADNVNSDSMPLLTAIITAGLYPNLGVQSRINPPRALRTAHENQAEISIQSIIAPRPASGKRYGLITRREAAPEGTIFVFSEKAQGDGSQINLRNVTKTSHLATLLFGRKLSTPEHNLLVVDDWIPFYLPRGFNPRTIMDLQSQLEEFLSRTFLRLGLANQKRLLAEFEEGFLGQDLARDPLVQGITTALDTVSKAFPRYLPGERAISNASESRQSSTRRKSLEEWEKSLNDDYDTLKDNPRAQALQYEQLQQHRRDQQLDFPLAGRKNDRYNDADPRDTGMNQASRSKSAAMNSSSWRTQRDDPNLRFVAEQALKLPTARDLETRSWRGRPDEAFQNKHKLILDALFSREQRRRPVSPDKVKRIKEDLLRDETWDFI